MHSAACVASTIELTVHQELEVDRKSWERFVPIQ